jgi:LmbE family N-acetylglucosaminyl deacetylase
MTLRLLIGGSCVLLAVSVSPNLNAARRQTPKPPPQTTRRVGPPLVIGPDTRLMVVAPHPDDEVLGTAGLMQRVHTAGGAIHVVYLTDGDGYPEGVRVEDHVEAPTAADYRGYGKKRTKEAREALDRLHLGKSVSTTFLGFPDAGLCRLTHIYWSEKKRAYRSPYTRLDRPPQGDVIVADTEYRGEDLSQELARVIGEFRPTLILVPRQEDQHEDHCAAWFFLWDALGDVERIQPGYTPDVVNYIIHFNSWPFQYEVDRLYPPNGLRGGASGWITFPLMPEEQRAKRAALQRYRSQMHVMRWFLESFARSNEVFSRPARTHIVLPTKSSPCCDK